MARSSTEALDDSIPEILYQCISITDNNCKRDDFVKCPLCHHLGKIFYCVDCVRNGDFTHSKKKCFERFADKKPRKFKIDAERASILKKYEHAFSKRKKIENAKLDIYKCKEKIQLLKESIKSYKDEIHKGQRRIRKLEEENAALVANRSQYGEKLTRMREVRKMRDEELEQGERKLGAEIKSLQMVVNHRIKELVVHIFPITKVAPSYFKDSTSGQCAELEEAQKTTYVQGQWVIAGSPPDEMEYAVVEPRIPVNGDYSAYINFCSSRFAGVSRDELDQVGKYRFDVAYGISAALAYTAQLVGILAFYMDSHVPKRTSYSDFCHQEKNPKEKFLHRVAKLNANVINLCLSQQVDASNINVHRTISNLLLLLENDSNKPKSLMSSEVHEDLMESIEESLNKDLLSLDESDSDDVEADYVHVSEEEEFLSIPEQTPYEPVQQPSSLVSSVYSLWRAATRQK
ncbi:beclin 1-associated autophagy-related key regulator-like isoform X2 [Uloborus diversus]|uniref:beclin 1-associated autophagy-related key regulator-like isoform X2 n=1 Tax=Uloborus diversus TaxID=327109 RepID=UPI0024093BF9|nr:beclin 1-associated autophagy-related key regulator-like isoform X2 [Uloborus diversus]